MPVLNISISEVRNRFSQGTNYGASGIGGRIIDGYLCRGTSKALGHADKLTGKAGQKEASKYRVHPVDGVWW